MLSSIKKYLKQTQDLLDKGKYTDGCSVPFIREWINKKFKYTKLLCAAHDYGNLNYLNGVYPGIHNQFLMLFAHLSMKNPLYWIWGVVIFIVTMPWILWKRNLKINILGILDFHIILLVLLSIATFAYFAPS